MPGTTVVFDNATINDAVAKAARIAPTKGAAFDKAAGIEFYVTPQTKTVRLRATNLECTYEQDVDCLEASGDVVNWRLPSALLTSFLGTLPMGDGAAIEFIDRAIDQALRLRCGRTVAKVHMYEGGLGDPIFRWNPTSEFVPAQDLTNKVEQVAWATDPKSTVLQGIHIDQKGLIATDSQVLAVVDADIALSEPMTVPLSTLTGLIKGASDFRIASGDGKRALLMLDEHTRATTVLMEAKYPDVRRVMREDFIGSLRIHRQQFTDTLERLMVLARIEKLPRLILDLDCSGFVKLLTLDLDIPDVSRMQDSIDVETSYDGQYKAEFTPTKIANALNQARSDFITLDFGHADKMKSPLSMIRLSDERGYISYIMPRKPT